MLQKENWRLQNLWVLLLCLFISLVVTGTFYYSVRQHSDEQIRHLSSYYAERTGSFINEVFHKTDILTAVVKLNNGYMNEKIFNNLAPFVYSGNSGIRALMYMPKGVVTLSYPVAGNEAVMGKDFFKIPERSNDLWLAVNTKSIALSGPYHLIQGGLGLVARNPIFLTSRGGQETFWGFAAVVLDLPNALEAVGLGQLPDSGYDFQLYCINENDDYIVIEGNPSLDISKSVTNKIQVPHHYWTLAVRPLNPWADLSKTLAVLLISLILSVIIWLLYCNVKQKTAAIEARNRFFSNVSHDMRTPLNAVIGFARLGQDPQRSAKEKDEHLRKIQDAGSLLLDLVNDTLFISKMESGKLTIQPVPVNTDQIGNSVLDTIGILAAQKNVIFVYDSSHYKPITILADQQQIEKILLNLLNNAVKFTPPGKHVWFTVADEPKQGNSQIMTFIIKDEGIGINKKFMPHLFEPFAQEQRPGFEGTGTGLGLSIVKQLVDAMQGTITVESTVGEGTTFTVRLPFTETTPVPAALSMPKSNDVAEQIHGKKVLLCEDNVLNRQIAAALLKHVGIDIDQAVNGQEGVEKFSHSAPGEYSAILMDLRMPILDGYGATKAIRELNRKDAKTIPIIAMTADVFADDIQNCLDAGMNDHVAKPIDPQILYATLGKHIK